MTYAGARGATETEMASVFHFPAEQVRLHEGFEALLGSLDTGAGFNGYRLNIANRLWGQAGFGMLDAFLDVTRERYGAELKSLDFRAAPEDSRETINTWVEEKTNGKIEDLMPPGSVTIDTRLVLTNAICFKGFWLSRFDTEKTRTEDFHVDPARTVSVSMMNQSGKFDLGQDEGLQVLRFPYETEDLSMVFLLPEAVDGVSDLESRLTVDNLGRWLDSCRETEVDVSLPRFRFASKFSLNNTLSGMGMPTAFSEGADFSGMNGDRNLFLQAAIHQAYVEVNEEGTEAAAATGVSVGVTSLPPSFRADHPFLILIRDEVTGSVLFLGRVVDPSPGG
jgi:serpin B